MRGFWRDNGLTITLMLMFLASVIGMALTGRANHNEELARHGEAGLSLAAYLASGEFLSALFENWESEFLQMASYVVLTAMLFQRGSAESRDPDDPDREHDEAPFRARHPVAGWLYEHSLGLALAGLFIASFLLHGWFSMVAANKEALRHGGEVKGLAGHLADAQFWFESFQNWQSEFLSTAVLVVLSIFLRHRGSPESKPVGAADGDTGA
jgi:membrane protein implicated in regulation of membrane protease activity